MARAAGCPLLGVLAAVGLAGCQATAGTAARGGPVADPAAADSGSPSAAAPAEAPIRAVGRVRMAMPELVLRFDVALMLDPDGRVRMDLALPTGQSAAVVWVERRRWILLDPGAADAYSGSVAEVAQLFPRMAPPHQASAVFGFGLIFLNGWKHFGKIWHLGQLPADAMRLVSLPHGGRLEFPHGPPWVLAFSGPDANGGGSPWPRRWMARRGPVQMEVEWLNVDTLNEAEMAPLTPRVPSSFRVRSLSALMAAAAAPATSPAPATATPPAP